MGIWNYNYSGSMTYICLICTVILGLLVQGAYPWYYKNEYDLNPRDMKKGYYYSKPSEVSRSLQEDQQLLNYIRNVKRMNFRKSCRPWGEPCDAWIGNTCCDNHSCKCAFWGQNCKCVTRLWG